MSPAPARPRAAPRRPLASVPGPGWAALAPCHLGDLPPLAGGRLCAKFKAVPGAVPGALALQAKAWPSRGRFWFGAASAAGGSPTGWGAGRECMRGTQLLEPLPPPGRVCGLGQPPERHTGLVPPPPGRPLDGLARESSQSRANRPHSIISPGEGRAPYGGCDPTHGAEEAEAGGGGG